MFHVPNDRILKALEVSLGDLHETIPHGNGPIFRIHPIEIGPDNLSPDSDGSIIGCQDRYVEVLVQTQWFLAADVDAVKGDVRGLPFNHPLISDDRDGPTDIGLGGFYVFGVLVQEHILPGSCGGPKKKDLCVMQAEVAPTPGNMSPSSQEKLMASSQMKAVFKSNYI